MFSWSKKTADQPNNEHSDHEHSDVPELEEEETPDPLHDVIFDVSVIASEAEKTGMLRVMSELRADSSLCDVAFLCGGVLFRAHRVIVSSWSRWMRALLNEGPDQEVVSLDVFDPEALGIILDYMYGAPLTISLNVI